MQPFCSRRAARPTARVTRSLTDKRDNAPYARLNRLSSRLDPLCCPGKPECSNDARRTGPTTLYCESGVPLWPWPAQREPEGFYRDRGGVVRPFVRRPAQLPDGRGRPLTDGRSTLRRFSLNESKEAGTPHTYMSCARRLLRRSATGEAEFRGTCIRAAVGLTGNASPLPLLTDSEQFQLVSWFCASHEGRARGR